MKNRFTDHSHCERVVKSAEWLGQEDTGLGKKGGGNIDFGAIPYFLVIADYEKAVLNVDS